MNNALDDWRIKLNAAAQRGNELLRRPRAARILLDAVDAFNTDRLSLLAASLSYYTLLTLFPLLLLIIALGSYFAAEAELIRSAGRAVAQFIPGNAVEVERILREAVDARGPATLFGIVALLWSASGLFDVVQTALDRAWRVRRSRAFWQQRLISLFVIVVIVLVFLTSILTSALTDEFVQSVLGLQRVAVNSLGRWMGVVIVFAALLVLYKFFPHAHVEWRAAVIGAALSTVLWEIAKTLFGLYLVYFARFSLVYGSVGAIIGFLLWAYISAAIVLFGGEVSATLERERTGSI